MADELVSWIYKLFCKIGLHQDVYGEGWVDVGDGVSVEFNGYRCVWCGRCKGLPFKTKEPYRG